MLYYLYQEFLLNTPVFNVLRYITLRTGGAMMTSALFVFLFAPTIISFLKGFQANGQPIRKYGPEEHFKKTGTPTMGGLIILSALIISSLLWANLQNFYVWLVLIVTFSFGLIGLYDDYLKVTKLSPSGLAAKTRLGCEFIIAIIVCYLITKNSNIPYSTSLAFPFFKNLMFDLGIFFIFFGAFVIVGSSNAVNLTDGLDGLAIVPVMIAASSFGIIAYLSGNIIFANYLQIHHVPGTGEIAVLCGALIGAGLGFLWFNAPPAAIFMGDTGSLSLGGMLGITAVATKHEIVLAIIGGLFVVEAMSVIIQVVSFKLTGKRVFRMAPIHHHYEKKGWTESQIVIRFWIVAVILALIGLSTLKLR